MSDGWAQDGKMRILYRIHDEQKHSIIAHLLILYGKQWVGYWIMTSTHRDIF